MQSALENDVPWNEQTLVSYFELLQRVAVRRPSAGFDPEIARRALEEGCVQCFALCCSVLQCVAVCCSALRLEVLFLLLDVPIPRSLARRRRTGVCSVLRCVAVCCSALQCVAVFSVLSCVAVRRPSPGTDPRLLDVHREKGACNVLQCAAATFQATLFPELLYLCISTFTVLLHL